MLFKIVLIGMFVERCKVGLMDEIQFTSQHFSLRNSRTEA